MLNKNYNKDTFDLKELDLHNGIEHDASFCRRLYLSHLSHALTNRKDRTQRCVLIKARSILDKLRSFLRPPLAKTEMEILF